MRVRELAASYMRTILAVGRNTDRLRIADAGNIVQQELTGQNLQYLPELARLAMRHMLAVQSGNPPSSENALADLMAITRPAPSQPQQR